MTDLQTLGNSFCELAWYPRTKDLVPLFDSKVHLYENSLLKMLAQLQFALYNLPMFSYSRKKMLHLKKWSHLTYIYNIYSEQYRLLNRYIYIYIKLLFSLMLKNYNNRKIFEKKHLYIFEKNLSLLRPD